MADTTFPHAGKVLDKVDLRRSFKLTAGAVDYISTGFTVAAATGLDVAVAAGEAFVDGTWIKRDVSTTLTMAASATNYVFAGYNATTPDTLVFTSNTTGASPGANYVLLAEVTTNTTAVTKVTDKRRLNALGGWGDPN